MRPVSILLVDDDSRIRLMLRTALEPEGYVIFEAADGREALEMIKGSAPELVLLDLNMPHLDGMAVLMELKSTSGPKPLVIVLTAYGSIAAAVNATRLGAVDFLEKPVTPGALREAVRSVLKDPELDAPPGGGEAPGGYERVLDRARKLLRMADVTHAEALLVRAAEQNAKSSADYFNLLGVIYEAQQKWRLARKCYGKAMRADGKYLPAKLNMKRIYELYTFGRSKQEVVLEEDPVEREHAELSQLGT
jgi:DNA-binding response OmpR family regulator